MEHFKINAIKTYQTTSQDTDFGQVWEMSDEDYEKMCNISDDEWRSEFGWWRGADGSNMGNVHKRYNINGHYIIAWDGYNREEWEREQKNLNPEDRWFMPRKYNNLLQYFCNELGASTEKNVCALATDLAEQNGIKMSELFKKYQG